MMNSQNKREVKSMALDNKTGTIMQRAYSLGLAVPAFNIPYLPMVEPVVQAVADLDSFGLVEVARLEWVKFESGSPAQVAEEFARWGKREHVRLHLDHIPVIDEDHQRVDYLPIIHEAIQLGYESVMVDGSRLPLEANIQAVRPVVELAHAAGVPVEAELGAVMGHESGPTLSYEELYASGKGFTDPEEARRFVRETGCDWLSVAIGNVHGAIVAGRKDLKKIEARLNLARLELLNQAAGVPLVLHGGSGIKQDNLLASMRHGIAKINVGTEIRQPYEVALKETGSLIQAKQAVYERTRWVLGDFLKIAGIRNTVNPD
jgi:fructose-bisphosphate aldolase, class II